MSTTEDTGAVASTKHRDKELLSCGICLQRYRNPKVLPCLDTFCADCLINYIPAESLSMTCPTCSNQSFVPEKGIAALQNNVFISNLIHTLDTQWCDVCQGGSDTSSTSTYASVKSSSSLSSSRATTRCSQCGGMFCDRCSSAHEEDVKHTVVRLIRLSECDATVDDVESSEPIMSLVCPSHGGQKLDYYCNNCETAVCKTCRLNEHGTHQIVPAAEAVENHKSILTNMIKNAQTRVDALKEAVSTVQQVNEQLETNYRDAQLCATDTFDMLKTMLNNRRSIVLSELEAAFRTKERTLADQLELLEDRLATVHSGVEITENAINRGNDTEILLIRKEMSEKLNKFACPTEELHEVPEENGFLTFNTSDLKNVRTVVGSVGCVQTNSAVSFETFATGEGLKKCEVDQRTAATITTKDKNGKAIEVGHSSFSCYLKAESLNNSAKTIESYDITVPEVHDNRDGTYELSYSVDYPGTYNLDIQLYGQAIKGSPFKIKATGFSDRTNGRLTPSTSYMSRIPKTIGKQRNKNRASSTRSLGSHRRSNPIDDDLLATLGVKGRNRGEFTNPQGVCCVGRRILVTDSNNQCVTAFSDTHSGTLFKMRFGSRGRHAGEMQRPIGVSVTRNGNYLIADFDNQCVSIYSSDGKYINRIGGKHLLGPKGVCTDNAGNIIVVDNKASCVFVFGPTGKLVHKFGSRGNEEHQFAGPHFCAVNSSDDIFVSDFHNHCVKVFDSEGTFKFSFGSNGEGNGQFNAPTGVAVDKNGNILVADWGNSRIQVRMILMFLILQQCLSPEKTHLFEAISRRLTYYYVVGI